MVPQCFAAPGSSSSTASSPILPVAAPSTMAPTLHLGKEAGSPPAWENGWLYRTDHIAPGSPSPAFADTVLTPSVLVGARVGNSSRALDVDLASSSHPSAPREDFSSPSMSLAQGELNVQEREVQRIKEINSAYRRRLVLQGLHVRSITKVPLLQRLLDHVFIDKKWYSLARKNKNNSLKVMILTAIAWPRFNSNGSCMFDGKIGCFPFVTYEAAKRSSVNRPRGTIEMKRIDPVEKDIVRAIHARWPPEDANKPIFIQQDNAEPYLAPSDALFGEVAKQDGFDMRLVCQPENSTNFSVLDLGFFNSNQSIQYKTIEDLVAAIHQNFEGYSVRQANRLFLANAAMEQRNK